MDNPSKRKRVVTVIGTRPEIIKCSTLVSHFDETFEHILIHTGQHYDDRLDAGFFRELGLRAPDVSLSVGSGTHASQLARMLLGIEPVLMKHLPDMVFVQGDTNSTLAGALAAAKLNIPVAHLEAGCRSFNRAMPEETNRILVDHLSDICLAPDEMARRNLLAEGIDSSRVVIVGSTAIDACLRSASLAVGDDLLSTLGVEPNSYLVATIHRAENTTAERLPGLMSALEQLSAAWPVIFPVHPRTAKALEGLRRPSGITYCEPVGYAQMMQLLRHCRALVTDSGGLQEEAAVLGAPTFIVRDETEWMEFVAAGHHLLVGSDPDTIVSTITTTLTGGPQENRMREPIGIERAGATARVLDALNRYWDLCVKGSQPWTYRKETSSEITHPDMVGASTTQSGM